MDAGVGALGPEGGAVVDPRPVAVDGAAGGPLGAVGGPLGAGLPLGTAGPLGPPLPGCCCDTVSSEFWVYYSLFDKPGSIRLTRELL